MQERSIPYYASQLHVTPHHLSATIKKAKWAECDVLDKPSHHTRGKATAEN